MNSPSKNFKRSIKKIFVRQHIKRMGIYLAFAFLGLVGFGLINHFFPESRTEFTGILSLGACVICSFFCLIKIFIEIFSLFMGPSKANHNPKRTIRKYYSQCLIYYGSFDFSEVRIGAMNFLLPETVSLIDNWEGFNKYWTQKNLNIINDFRDTHNFDQTSFRLGEITFLKTMDDLIDFDLDIEFIGEIGLGTTQSPKKTFNLGIYKVVNQLKKINNAWYIANIEWNGEIIKI